MKAVFTILSILSLGLLGRKLWSAVTTQKTADELKIEVTGAKKFAIKGGAVQFDLEFEILNPTSDPITINNVFLDIAFKDGPKVTSINTFDPIVVPKLSKTIGLYHIESKQLVWLGTNILSKIIDLIKGNENPKLPDMLTVKGTVRCNGFSQPFYQEIPIKI